MVNKELECFAPKDRQMVAVELGSSYGNTTLSYKCGHNWDAAVDFWLKEDTPMVKKWDFHVVAIDISEKALGFGKRRGIFDEVLVHDFADAPAPELAAALERADFLTSIMTTFYIPTDRLNEMLFKFLGNRSKPKVRTKPRPLPRGSSARRACEVAGAGARGAARALSGRGGAQLLVYNVMMAFDSRNLTPEVLFGHVKVMAPTPPRAPGSPDLRRCVALRAAPGAA
jgi:hypothetical protein